MLRGCRRMADPRASKLETPFSSCTTASPSMIADLPAETGSSTNDAGIAVAPIMSIPAKDTHLAALNHYLGAVAIVFDFVNPVLALWRLIDRGSKLWFDESETGVTRNMVGL
jgi:hypothetical protein